MSAERCYRLRVDRDHFRLEVIINPRVWEIIRRPHEWYEIDKPETSGGGVFIPPHGLYDFGYSHALRHIGAHLGDGWPTVVCTLPPNGLNMRPTRLNRIVFRLASLRMLFQVLEFIRQGDSRYNQPLAVQAIEFPSSKVPAWQLRGLVTRSAIEDFRVDDPMWGTVTEVMRSLYRFVGGSPAGLTEVGGQWYDTSLHFACGQSSFASIGESLKRLDASQYPLAGRAKHPAEIFVLLGGLATLDNMLWRQSARRAA